MYVIKHGRMYLKMSISCVRHGWDTEQDTKFEYTWTANINSASIVYDLDTANNLMHIADNLERIANRSKNEYNFNTEITVYELTEKVFIGHDPEC